MLFRVPELQPAVDSPAQGRKREVFKAPTQLPLSTFAVPAIEPPTRSPLGPIAGPALSFHTVEGCLKRPDDTRLRFGSANSRTTTPGHQGVPQRWWRAVCQSIPRPSETVTSPSTHERIPAKCEGCVRHGSNQHQDVRGRMAAISTARQGLSDPCRTPKDALGRHYPPQSQRCTFWYVLPELAQLRSSVPPQDRLALPGSQKTGVCHRCFHVSFK